MVDALVDFAARVDRASDAIVDDGRCARLAVEQGIAGLRTVTKEPVVAETVLGQMLDEIPLFVAGVLGVVTLPKQSPRGLYRDRISIKPQRVL